MMTLEKTPPSLNELDWYFPAVEPGVVPLGGRILVQIKRVKRKSAGGLVLVEETKETEKWNTQVAKVIALGPLAFRKRDSMEFWPEGTWANMGDFIRAPKYGGDRFEVPVPAEDEPALFMVINDFEVIAKITGDPLTMKAFI